MAMPVRKYRVWCDTDSQWEYVWLDDTQGEPTVCPTNTAHTIDTSKTSIVEEVIEDTVTIKEENTPTGGHYQAQFNKINIPSGTPGTKHEFEFSFPHPISLLAAEWTNTEDIHGDEIKFIIAPDTIVGVLASGVSNGETVLPVSQSVIDNVKLGYCVDLYSASGVCEVERCVDRNDNDNTITVETAVDQGYAAGTHVRMHVDMVRRGYLAGHGRIQLGEAKIGGSYIPAGTILRADYWNNNGTAKELVFVLEYLY